MKKSDQIELPFDADVAVSRPNSSTVLNLSSRIDGAVVSFSQRRLERHVNAVCGRLVEIGFAGPSRDKG